MTTPRSIRIWDRFVRVFHWSLATSIVVAWISADEWREVHIWAGTVAAVLVACRVAWGVMNTRYARFVQFVRSPAIVAGYLWDAARGRERRYLGHNPAGGMMIVVLLVGIAVICASGWLFTTDAFWGVGWLEDSHEALGNLLIGLVALHVGGVIVASIRHRENLLAAMISGRKRPPSGSDVA